MEVSKEGLSEEELKAILHIDAGIWSPMFFAMASFILDRAGLYRYDVRIEIVLYFNFVMDSYSAHLLLHSIYLCA